MRNPYSGGGGFGGRRAIPQGIKILLIANGLVYLLQQLFGHEMTLVLGLIPAKVLNLETFTIYQLFTYMFLHGGFFHILMNMFILWMFGSEIELTWGTKSFFKYYFLTGIAGGLFTVIFQPSSMIPTIGASGAIYGILVAYAVMFPNRTIYLYFLFPVKVKYAVLIFVGFEFLASLGSTPDGVGHLAHLGGAAVGYLYLKMGWQLRGKPSAFSPKKYFNFLRYKRKSNKLEKNRQKSEEIMKRVDRILDKINEIGIENISEEERQFLGNASELLSEKDE